MCSWNSTPAEKNAGRIWTIYYYYDIIPGTAEYDITPQRSTAAGMNRYNNEMFLSSILFGIQ